MKFAALPLASAAFLLAASPAQAYDDAVCKASTNVCVDTKDGDCLATPPAAKHCKAPTLFSKYDFSAYPTITCACVDDLWAAAGYTPTQVTELKKGTKKLGETCTTFDGTTGAATMCEFAAGIECDFKKVDFVTSADLVCVSESLRAYGDKCTDNYQCDSHQCSAGLCAGGIAAGGACQFSWPDIVCLPGLNCVNSVCTATPKIGDACTYFCPVNAYCDSTCKAKLTVATGAAATFTDACETEYLVNGVCMANDYTKIGTTCTADADCTYKGGQCSCTNEASSNVGKCALGGGLLSYVLHKEGMSKKDVVAGLAAVVGTNCRDFSPAYDDHTGELYGCAFQGHNALVTTFAKKYLQYMLDPALSTSPKPFSCGVEEANPAVAAALAAANPPSSAQGLQAGLAALVSIAATLVLHAL